MVKIIKETKIKHKDFNEICVHYQNLHKTVFSDIF
jgi:hypothetical protein